MCDNRRMDEHAPAPAPAPTCPRCSRPMRLFTIVPKVGAFPELYTFSCEPCHEAVTLERQRDVSPLIEAGEQRHAPP